MHSVMLTLHCFLAPALWGNMTIGSPLVLQFERSRQAAAEQQEYLRAAQQEAQQREEQALGCADQGEQNWLLCCRCRAAVRMSPAAIARPSALLGPHAAATPLWPAEFTPAWRAAGLPTGPSALRLDGSRLAAAQLLDPLKLGSGHRSHVRKEVLQPPLVLQHNDATQAPHYLQATSNLRVSAGG